MNVTLEDLNSCYKQCIIYPYI